MSLQRSSTRRIANDVKSIMTEPIDNIYYFHDETDIRLGYILIIGFSDTVYSYGYHFFKIEFPENYPYSPPSLTYMSNNGSMRFHPNLYTCGKVCLSIINTWVGEGWTSCQTLRSICIILSSILDNYPLLHEPGIKITDKIVNTYNLLIKYKNIELLICEIINKINHDIKNVNQFNTIFIKFKDIVNRNFINNYYKILEKLENLESEFKENNINKININIYNLNYNCDSKQLKIILNNTYKRLNKTI